MILLVLFNSAASFGQTEMEIFAEVSVTCASTLGMAAILTEAELSKMVFTRDAQWWRSMLVNIVDATEADHRIEIEMTNIKDRWNGEELTWDELLDIGQQCSQMKLTLEQD